MSHFDELGLSGQALQAVAELGYASPTPVQQQAIPYVLEGRDLIAAAKTGTGKTAAFSLPSMDKLGHAKGNKGPLMLVVTPTRELAEQIGEVCGTIAHHTHHRILTVVGGVSYNPQIQALGRGVDILIATPGRLVDLMEQGAAHLSNVEVLVLDEADRMLDMGFWPAMKKIISATPSSRQTLLFSATIDHTIMKTAGKLLRNPAMVEIAHKGETADTVEQYVMHVQQAVKPALLKGLLKERGHRRVIVFCRTRSRADATCRRLKKVGYHVEAIHSSRSQNQRRRALENFANGQTDVLVATDVLARGIDVEEVEYVVNYDLPTVPEDYVHRIGRTGRAGATGFAVSFVSPETADALRDIQKLVKREIPELELEDFDMHEAEMEAAAKAQQAEARRDPEIQQAKKEEAARKRKKARAREAAAAVEDARSNRKGAHNNHSGKKHADKPASGTAKASKKHANAQNTPAAKPAKAKRSAKGGAGEAARKGGAGKNAAGKAKSAPKRAAAAPAGDFRPGRAHRAAVASQRNRRR